MAAKKKKKKAAGKRKSSAGKKRKSVAKKRKPSTKKGKKRSSAGKRRYKGSALHKYNMKRAGKKMSGKAKGRAYAARKSSIIGVKGRHKAHKQSVAAGKASRALHHAAAKSYIAKGYNKTQANKLASRYVRAVKYAASKATAGSSAGAYHTGSSYAERMKAAMAEEAPAAPGEWKNRYN